MFRALGGRLKGQEIDQAKILGNRLTMERTKQLRDVADMLKGS